MKDALEVCGQWRLYCWTDESMFVSKGSTQVFAAGSSTVNILKAFVVEQIFLTFPDTAAVTEVRVCVDCMDGQFTSAFTDIKSHVNSESVYPLREKKSLNSPLDKKDQQEVTDFNRNFSRRDDMILKSQTEHLISCITKPDSYWLLWFIYFGAWVLLIQIFSFSEAWGNVLLLKVMTQFCLMGSRALFIYIRPKCHKLKNLNQSVWYIIIWEHYNGTSGPRELGDSQQPLRSLCTFAYLKTSKIAWVSSGKHCGLGWSMFCVLLKLSKRQSKCQNKSGESELLYKSHKWGNLFNLTINNIIKL